VHALECGALASWVVRQARVNGRVRGESMPVVLLPPTRVLVGLTACRHDTYCKLSPALSVLRERVRAGFSACAGSTRVPSR
jgi:hypothetical protein